MGATFSSGNNVAIWCDKPDYFSGDVVQGYVLLNVCQPIAATSLLLEFKGAERTSWEEVTTHREYVKGPPPPPCCHCRAHCHGRCRGTLGHALGHGHAPLKLDFSVAADVNGRVTLDSRGQLCSTSPPGPSQHQHHHHGNNGHGQGQAAQGYWREVERRQFCSSTNDFFKVSVPLHHWDASRPLAPGQYQFPFRLALPNNLPGSFRYDCDRWDVGVGRRRHNVVGKIRYKVKACVLKNSRLLGLVDMTTHLHGSQEILVRQRLSRPPAELSAETVTNVKTCFCLRGHGLVVVRVRAAKDAYVAGEAATMLLEIENQTDLFFKDVCVAIDRQVHLKASGSCHTVSETITKLKFPGLPKNTSYVGDAARRLVLPLPATMVPTTLGSLVSCTYTARVELSAGMLTNNARLLLPLTIYAAPHQHQAYDVRPPEFWRPQMVAPAVEVPLPMAGPAPVAYAIGTPVYAAA